MGATVASRNRKIRQDALREYLAERGSVQYLFDLIEKAEKLDPSTARDELPPIKAAIDARIKLLDKYMPSLKSMELTGEDGGAIKTESKVEWVVQPVKPLDEA